MSGLRTFRDTVAKEQNEAANKRIEEKLDAILLALGKDSSLEDKTSKSVSSNTAKVIKAE